MVQNPAERRPRGRPRSFDPDEVLEKAREVFWDLGYAAASLDELARATGLNRPSLYAAFGDKHALYITALRRTRETATAAMRAMLERDGPLREGLARLFRGAIAAYVSGGMVQRGCFVVATAVTQAVDDPEARDVLAGYVADEDALFRERFSRSGDELAPGLTPDAAAVLATATLHTLAIRARMGEGREALAQVAEAAVGAICGPA